MVYIFRKIMQRKQKYNYQIGVNIFCVIQSGGAIHITEKNDKGIIKKCNFFNNSAEMVKNTEQKQIVIIK